MLGNSGLVQGVTTGATNSGLKMEFPFFSIRDSINVEYRLLKEYLGIDHVLVVLGPSIGAMKSYQFARQLSELHHGGDPDRRAPLPSPMTRWFLNAIMDVIAMDSAGKAGTTRPTR